MRSLSPHPCARALRALRGQWALSAAFYLVVALLLTWPILSHLDTHLIGDISHPALKGDLLYQYDLQRQMQDGKIPTHQHMTVFGYPDGTDVQARDSFASHLVVYALLMTVFSLFAAHNIATLLFLLMNALSMHALIWERTRRLPLALMSGLLFAFGPYSLLKAEQGFTQKICIFTVPLFLLFLLRLLERHRTRDLLLSLLVLVVSLTIYPPYAVYNMVFAALLVIPMAFREGSRPLWRVAPFFGVAAVLFGLFALLQSAEEGAMAVNVYRPWEEGGFFDLTSPLRWYPYEFTFGDNLPAAFVPKLTLGFPLLVGLLALLAAVKKRPYSRLLWIPALVFGVIMAGPYLPMDPHGGTSDSPGLEMPFYYLIQLPAAGVWRFPIRMYPWILMALLLAAAEGVRWLEAPERLERVPKRYRPAWLTRAWPHLAWLILALVVLENRAIFPARLSVTEPTVPAFYTEIRDDDFGGLLLLPQKPRIHNAYMYAALTSKKALVNAHRGGPITPKLPKRNEPRDQQARYLHGLLDDDVRYVVVYLDFLDAEVHYDQPAALLHGSQFHWLDPLCGPARIYPDENMAVYDLRRLAAAPGREE